MPLTIALRATVTRSLFAAGFAGGVADIALANTQSEPPPLDSADVARLRRLLAEQRQIEAPTEAEIVRLRRALLTKN